MLTACSSGTSVLTAEPAAGAAVIISDATRNVVEAFDVNGNRIATIAGFNSPQRLATDAAGNIRTVLSRKYQRRPGNSTSASYTLAFHPSMMVSATVKITPKGDIARLNTGYGSRQDTIETYLPPAAGQQIGTDISTMPLIRGPSYGQFAFTRSGAAMWETGGGTATEQLFPAGGTPIRAISTGGNTAGIVVTPLAGL